jgi:hypothetical protein
VEEIQIGLAGGAEREREDPFSSVEVDEKPKSRCEEKIH